MEAKYAGYDGEWIVTDKRVDEAKRMLMSLAPLFTDDEIVEIAACIGLDPCLSYTQDEEGYDQLRYEFTNDLQMIALAAVLHCVNEVQDR